MTPKASAAFWLTVCFACAPAWLAAAPARAGLVSEAGAWSKTVDGVQGRLVVLPGTVYKGTRLPHVYLELRNVSDVGSPKDVNYNNGEGLTLEVVDAQNKRIAPHHGAPFNQIMPLPFGVMLPFDSDLRFLVSLSGYGIPRQPGLFLEIGGPHGPVFLPYGTPRAFFLRGTFATGAEKRANAQGHWSGVLTVPEARGQWSGILSLPSVDVSPFTRKP